MAVNQSSFFLYPPRYRPEVEYDSSESTYSGGPLEIIDSSLHFEDKKKIFNEDVLSWFRKKGFNEKESYGGLVVIYSERDKGMFGMQEVIEASIAIDEEELKELYIRFLLNDSTPKRESEWCELLSDLGAEFNLMIMEPETHDLIPTVDFKTLLLRDHNYSRFSKNLGWKRN